MVAQLEKRVCPEKQSLMSEQGKGSSKAESGNMRTWEGEVGAWAG